MRLSCRGLRVALLAAVLLPATASADAIDLAWVQPAGRGSDLVITYSYSNLLDGTFLMIDRDQLRAATFEALSLWATHAPLHFVERRDSGPAPSDTAYSADDHPQIRIGHHDTPDLGHSFFPNAPDGRAGDVHFDSGTPWTLGDGRWNFLEVLTHELGHSLGLEHVDSEPAIMNPFFPQSRFSTLGTGFLLPPDIEMLHTLYGPGTGSVDPLDPIPEPGSLSLVSVGVLVLARRRRRRRRGAERTEGAELTEKGSTRRNGVTETDGEISGRSGRRNQWTLQRGAAGPRCARPETGERSGTQTPSSIQRRLCSGSLTRFCQPAVRPADPQPRLRFPVPPC